MVFPQYAAKAIDDEIKNLQDTIKNYDVQLAECRTARAPLDTQLMSKREIDLELAKSRAQGNLGGIQIVLKILDAKKKKGGK